MKSISIAIILLLISFPAYSISINEIKKQNYFNEAVKLYENGEINKALAALKKLKIVPHKEAHRYFFMSKLSLELSYFEEAKKYIDKAIEYKIDIKDYAYFLKGLIYWESQKDLDNAKNSFKKALSYNPIRSLKNDINFYLAKTYNKQKNIKEARPILEALRGSFRNDPRKPEVLWLLVQIYAEQKEQNKMCKWSRHLYSYFPFSKYISSWNVNLAKNKILNKPSQCQPTYHEKKRRIKKLLWAGKDKMAKADVELIKKSKNISSKNIDRLNAVYLLHIGDVQDALKLLLKNYKNIQSDFDYLMLLGKAAYKAGEYQTAVGCYHKAFKLAPNSEQGKSALFRSAFLSYQFQDYDGATRKYKQYIKTYPSSQLVKDSKYHIAWMKYLRGQYKLAITGFENILAERKKSKRGWRKYPTTRIQYWLGMSYLKINENKIAWNIFKKLSEMKNNQYYSFAALSRLKQIPYDPNEVKVGEANNQERVVANSEYNFVNSLKKAQISPSLLNSNTTNETEDNINNESINYLDVDHEASQSFWSKPKLQENISRVETLIEMGQTNWAYRDLKVIEAHVSDRKMYNQFIKNYRLLSKYTRSSYLTELKILPKYLNKKLKDNYNVWQLAYPKAYENIVNKYATEYSVPNHFVWSIMRAESRYNPDAESPVGAKGLMQLMPYTARHLINLLGDKNDHTLNLHEPSTNIKLGTRYLNRLLKQFKNQIPLAAAAYNAGPHRVKSWLAKFGNLELDEFIEHIPFVETRNYVKRVTRFYGTYKKAYDLDVSAMNFLAQNIPVKHTGPIPTKENWN